MADRPTVLSEILPPGIARITLNRAGKRNALDLPTRGALSEAIDRAIADDTVKAIILTGAGGHFCAGGDLASMTDQTAHSARARMKPIHHLARSLAGSDKPIVAAVEGHASGAGAGLALLCDVIVAGRSATFGFSFLKLGLVPDCGLLHTLPARVGPAIARRLLLTGASMAALDGEKLGLIDHLVADDAVQQAALEAASGLASMPATALAMIRHGLSLSLASLDAALDYEIIAQAACMTSDDFTERLAAAKGRSAERKMAP